MADVFKALADPTRRTILDELRLRDDQTLFEICSRLATKHGLGSTRQAISQHLAVLEAAGLVRARRDGRYKLHSINTEPLTHMAERWAGVRPKGAEMRIHLTSVFVDDQEKALRFYTEILGFEKMEDVPVGEHRWLTVVSPSDRGGTQLLLEPDAHPATRPFKEALTNDGIPFTSFAVDDVHTEHERLSKLGVRFTQQPTDLGPATTAVFEDTCGNLIGIAHRNAPS